MKTKRKSTAGNLSSLSANIDAVEVAGRFGIDKSRAQNFLNDSEGIALNYSVLSESVASYRAALVGECFGDNWSDEIQADFEKRRKQKKYRFLVHDFNNYNFTFIISLKLKLETRPH